MPCKGVRTQMSPKSSYITRAAGALFLSIAAVVGVHEGRSLVAYYDAANVLTICDGDTSDVQPGQKATHAECDDRLRKGIADHARALQGLPEGLPDVVVLGSVDLAYNIGVQGFSSSSVRRALMMKDYRAAGAVRRRSGLITHHVLLSLPEVASA